MGSLPPQPSTVQEYIDETPVWRDGTPVTTAPMTRIQWRVWTLATAGKFFEGLVVFMTGVALPLIVKEFGLDAFGKGAVGAATLFGILIGASALGGLSDRYGRRRMFIVEMLIFVICLAGLVISPNVWLLLASLFGVGLALGCDYPTAHMVISEAIPSSRRGRLVLAAFAFQAVGALVGTGVGYLVLEENLTVGAWRWMYATAIFPAVLVFLGRFFIPDSGHWLLSQGRRQEAEEALAQLLAREPAYPTQVRLTAPSAPAVTPEAENPAKPPGHPPASGFAALFSKQHRRATILAAIPWFLQDLGTYGIGIFTPTILAGVLGAESRHAMNVAEIIHNQMLASEGAAFIDTLLLAGIILAILLVDRVGRIKLQVIGFAGCALGLAVAGVSLSATGEWRMALMFAGFMCFSLMTNLGPNAMTYLLAGEVFPTRIRGKGAGFAASFAKIGAVSTAFLFPILLKDLGVQLLLGILVATSLLGAFLTWRFRIETTGTSLEEVGE